MFGHDIDTDLEAAKRCIGLVPQEINLNLWEKIHNIVMNRRATTALANRGP